MRNVTLKGPFSGFNSKIKSAEVLIVAIMNISLTSPELLTALQSSPIKGSPEIQFFPCFSTSEALGYSTSENKK